MKALAVLLPIALASVLGAAPVSARESCVATPNGCVDLNPDVTTETLKDTICRPGYTRSVRPASSYTNGVKAKLLRAADLPLERMREHELDHIVPLALGGHPRRLSNLMLQPWEGADGAKAKDRLETRLARAVCRGRIALEDAQRCIAEDWQACAEKHPGRDSRR